MIQISLTPKKKESLVDKKIKKYIYIHINYCLHYFETSDLNNSSKMHLLKYKDNKLIHFNFVRFHLFPPELNNN